MRVIDRHVLLPVFWKTLFLGLIATPMLAGVRPALAEAPIAESESEAPVLLAFQADWCGACRQMEAAVDALARDGYSVQRVNVDANRELVTRFGVNAIPCFIIVERSKEVDRIVGQASIERLKLKLPRLTAPQREARVPPHDPLERRTPPIDIGNKNPPERRPHPAWRYEKPVGHRAAVVRIYCQDDVRTRSIGSGTLVRWGAKKIVVLTARHVIQDAKTIIVELFNKRTYKARVLKVDAIWDCAVLELIGTPAGVEPADVELGDAAMQQQGNRLESCGYGPDGRLACNTGLFLGYKRSAQMPNGPDDWFEISGRARQGDSGGGVFNERGRLVGVLWGTNGEVVVGVQAGRLHVLLDAAVLRTIAQQSYTLLAFGPRNPTPPKSTPLGDLPASSDTCGPGGCRNLPSPVSGEGPGVRAGENGTVPFESAGSKILPGPVPYDQSAVERRPLSPVLPWRGAAQQRDDELNARTGALLRAIEAERQARLSRDATPPAIVEPPKTETNNEEPSLLLAGLCILAAVVVGFVIYFSAQK